MEIVVCIKAVCASPAKFSLSAAKDRIDCGSRSLTMNEVDEYALDAALALKKQLGGSITAITVGPLAAQDVLYICRAKGTERAIRVDADLAEPLAVSDILARVIRGLKYDLVLAGVESSDNMAGVTGIYTAERLGLPSAYAVTKIEATAHSTVVRVTKELGGGTSQVLDIALPALLCVQSGIQPLSYAPVARLMRIRREPLMSVSLDSLGLTLKELAEDAPFRLVDLFQPQRLRQAEMLEGEPRDIAGAVVQRIREVL